MVSAGLCFVSISLMVLAASEDMDKVDRIDNILPASCSVWKNVVPPVDDGVTKWVVHDSDASGLGDWIGGYLSAFYLAVATRRRLYVKNPFAEGTTLYPYDVAPPSYLWNSVQVFRSNNRCPEWPSSEFSDTSIWLYTFKPNRACAGIWMNELTSIWRMLDARANTLQAFENQTGLIYGCPLQFFQPKPQLEALLQAAKELKRRSHRFFAVHIRTNDNSFSLCPQNAQTDSLLFAHQIDTIIHLNSTHTLERRNNYRKITILLESDSDCIKNHIHQYLLGLNNNRTNQFQISFVPSQSAIHDSAKNFKQLAAWFSFGLADTFIVARYSGWSASAMVRAAALDLPPPTASDISHSRLGSPHFHILCHNPRYYLDKSPKACNSTRSTTFSLPGKYGALSLDLHPLSA